jgi:predicted nucleic acid-binding protein
MGTVIIDAGVLIGFRNPQDTHHESARAALADARRRDDVVAIPASALSEYLVHPAKAGREAVARAFEFVRRLPIEVVAFDEAVAVEAAMLRSERPELRMPDAMVIATARLRRADVLVTTDRRWPSKRALKFAGKLVVL